MNAAQAPEACPNCGAEAPTRARFCPECGTRLDAAANQTFELRVPAGETGPVPITMQRAEPRWFGMTPPHLLLGTAAVILLVAIVLVAIGHWPFGLILLGLAALLLAGFMEAARNRPRADAPIPSGSRMRERTQSAWEEWRARAAAAAEVKRIQAALLMIDSDRKRALGALGAAAHARDSMAEASVRAHLGALDEQEAFLHNELDRQLSLAGERIRQAKLPVQDTMMVLPSEPSPPPGEATPPQPAVVPEPYPPPDEGTPPQPAPVPEPGPGGND
jgi:zinc ribbon protein